MTHEEMLAELAGLEAAPASRLGPEEYSLVQQQLVLFGAILARLPLDAFLAEIMRAEALGPIVDPTLYRRGIKKLERVKALANAANGFRQEVLRQAHVELSARKAAESPL